MQHIPAETNLVVITKKMGFFCKSTEMSAYTRSLKGDWRKVSGLNGAVVNPELRDMRLEDQDIVNLSNRAMNNGCKIKLETI